MSEKQKAADAKAAPKEAPEAKPAAKAEKSAADIAAEARKEADAAEADAQEFEQLAQADQIEQVEAALAEARKALEVKQNALVRATKDVDAATKAVDDLIERLEVVRPPLTTMELIQKHLTEQTEKQRAAMAAGKALLNPIDSVTAPGSTPLQYLANK